MRGRLHGRIQQLRIQQEKVALCRFEELYWSTCGNGPFGVRVLLFIPMALRMPDSESTLDSEKALHELLLLWESVYARPDFARLAWLGFKIVGNCGMSLSYLHYAFKIAMSLGSRQARGYHIERVPAEHRELTMVRDPHIECRTAGHYDHFQA